MGYGMVTDYEAELSWNALCRRYNELELMILTRDGYAMPDGTFPIVDETDLGHAVNSWGLYSERPIASRRHICRRAGELRLATPMGFCG